MSSSLRSFATAALVLTFGASPALAQGDKAFYEVTFDATWSSTTHPSAFPPFAHFSPLVGATHNSGVTFWEPGALASQGIEFMAETGGTSQLQSEVNAAIGAGTAGSFLLGAGVFVPAVTSFDFMVTETHPEVSLVTMIAPSPDWFVGIHGVSLLDNGTWVQELTIPLYAYDSGTDSGLFFQSSNSNTSPPDPITLITGGPFFGTTPLGTFTFRRKWSALSYGCGLNPQGSLEVVAGAPTIGASVSIAVDDPTSSMNTPAFSLFAVSPNAFPNFPCGASLANFGMGAPGTPGEVLIGTIGPLTPGPVWNGSPTPFQVSIPNDIGLVGQSYYMQGALGDGSRIGLTEGLELHFGQ